MSALPVLESLEKIPFPPSPATTAPYHPPTWLASAPADLNNDPILFFHDEILAFARWVSPNKAEVAWRNQIVERLSRCVRAVWPSANIQVYGSTESGLSVPQSDIDVVIQNANAGEGEFKFHVLADKLEAEGVTVGRPFIVGGSRVPVMKMIDAESGCLVDVSFEGHSGPANTRLVMGFLDSFPLARPLALVVKYYLKQRKLNDTYLGGVGSYTLALLVVSFMQRYSNQSQSLPVLLCAFFELYGIKFDYMNTVISVLHGGSYLSKEEKGWQNPEFEDALAVEDPLLPEIDVGYASFNMREVRTAFAEAFDILTRGPVQISPNGAPYHHVLKMSFLRRLINVASKEVSHRKKIRDAYYSSLAKHASQAKAQQRPTAPVAATSSLTPAVTPTQHTVSESKPRRRKPKKSPPKPRGEKVPTSETVALAGANSASAASVGGSDAHSSADVSDASHNSPKSSSNNSSDEGYGSDPSLYDSDKDSSGSEWLAPHDSIHLPEIASDSCGAPATTLIKDDANFPTLEYTVGKPFQKPSSMHPPRVA